ncbi:MAG: hypothetical protein Q9204_005824 [Flavoplaca sp. TL-2023a]
MTRASEKTFGKSPESMANKKPPRKRVKLESPKPRASTPAGSMTNDSSDDSDARPIPSGKYRANTKRPSRGASTTTAKRRPLEATPLQDDDQDLSNIGKMPSAIPRAKQTLNSLAPDDRSTPDSEASEIQSTTPRSAPPNIARPKPSENTRGSGNILERLGRFPGSMPSSHTSEDEDEDDSDHSVPQEQDVSTPILAVEKYQKASDTRSKSKANCRKGSKKEVQGKFIAAFDFGTTYSGVCWAHTELPQNSKLINKWPDVTGKEGHSGDKVPTELQYIGPDKWLWGTGIPATALRLQWFKLELEPDKTHEYARLQEEYPDDRAARRTRSQTPETLTKDYLTSLRLHFEYMLSKVLGASLDTTPIEYVLTIPAIWTDTARNKTKAAAEGAGMGRANELYVISEPEAAAVWAFHEMVPWGLRKGETFVVCDAGGGTVDLITYRITALKPSLRIAEVAKGEGGMCGSTMLDRSFASFLRDKFGDDPMWSENLLEDVKPRFRGSKTEEWDIPVPGLPDSADDAPDRVRHSRYHLKGSDVYDIFEPVIKQIINLVIQQIKVSKKVGAEVQGVIMVGGFGENIYLFERLQKALKSRHIEVRVSPQAWTAVVRGALIRGLEEARSSRALGTVVGRIARYSYGTECAREYERSKHQKSDREWSKANNRWEVNTYEWFIKKHSKVAEKNPICSYYHIERPVPRPIKKKLEPLKITIYKCEDNAIPTVVGIQEGNVEELAHLEIPLSKLPTKSFSIRHGENGQDWYIIDFTIRATCHSTETYYDLWHNSKQVERIIAEYV